MDLQYDALILAGVLPERIYKDLGSGRNDNRPGLETCLKYLQPGNTLVVWKLDRLGRNLKHLVNTVDNLRQRDIGFKVLSANGAQIAPLLMGACALAFLQLWLNLNVN